MARDKRHRAMLAIAAAGALFAIASARPLDVDIGLHGDAGGHALVRFGFATIRLVFDSGQECSISNTCSGARL